MEERIRPTGGPGDPFYNVWQRVSAPAGERAPLPAPEMGLNEWLRRQLRLTDQRERLARAWRAFWPLLPLCRRERQVLGSALFLRSGLTFCPRGEGGASGDLAQDCRQLCLLLRQSEGSYSWAAGETAPSRLSAELSGLGRACGRWGDWGEDLLGELLRRQGRV